MDYYHCSPTHGIRILEPRIPASFAKPKGVYLTTLLPMALIYGIQEHDLLNHPGPMADYYRIHYPASWAMAQERYKAYLSHPRMQYGSGGSSNDFKKPASVR